MLHRNLRKWIKILDQTIITRNLVSWLTGNHWNISTTDATFLRLKCTKFDSWRLFGSQMEFDTNALLPNTDYDDVCHRLLPDSNLALKQRIHRMKCFTCSICSYRSNAHSPRQSYMNNNTVLPSVNCVRDLGVIVDCHLKFDAHISLIVRKAMLRSRLILKCFSSRNKDLMMKAFFTYVRQIL